MVELSPPVHEGRLDGAYASPRDDVTALVPGSAKRVLDLGCSTGTLGESLRARGCEVTGIELVADFANQANLRLNKVVQGDVEALAAQDYDPGRPFDCVVMADVLEHLRDPWSVVRWAAGLLDERGAMVISVPNIRHLRLWWSVGIHRRWLYQPVGIFDRTHLRWFAYHNLEELLDGTKFRIVELRRVYRVRNQPSQLDRLAPVLGDFATMQFVFRCERTDSKL